MRSLLAVRVSHRNCAAQWFDLMARLWRRKLKRHSRNSSFSYPVNFSSISRSYLMLRFRFVVDIIAGRRNPARSRNPSSTREDPIPFPRSVMISIITHCRLRESDNDRQVTRRTVRESSSQRGHWTGKASASRSRALSQHHAKHRQCLPPSALSLPLSRPRPLETRARS